MLQLIRVGNKHLGCVPKFNYKLRRPAPKMTEYDKERIQYKNLMNQYRSRLVKEFWEEQTKLENQYIDDYLAKEKAKSERLEVYRRSQTVIQTYNTTQLYNRQQEKLRERNERVKKYFVEQDIKKMNRQQIIKVLNEESKSWIYDFEQSPQITDNLLIPNTILDQVAYYQDLSEKAVLYETAQYDEIDKQNDPNNQMVWKNRLGMPLYQRIVQLVKFLKQDNELGKLKMEWDTCQAIILTDKTLNEQQINEQLDKINGAFQTLIADKIQQLESDPIKRLQEMNKQLIRLYNLLELWDKYITIVKMDQSTAQQIIQAQETYLNLFDSDGQHDYMITEIDVDPKKKSKADELKDSQNADSKYISADEQHTDSEDIDLEKLSQKKEFEDIYGGRTTKSYKFDTEKIKDKDQKFKDLIEDIFAKAEEKAKQAGKEFELNYRKNPNIKVLYNTSLTPKNFPDARSIFQGVDLEQLFPQELLQNQSKSPYLDFKSIEDIENHFYRQKAFYSLRTENEENAIQNPDIFRFNTSVAAETYKQQIKNISVPTEYQKLRDETEKLIEAVGQIKILDADFLLKIWNYYN